MPNDYNISCCFAEAVQKQIDDLNHVFIFWQEDEEFVLTQSKKLRVSDQGDQRYVHQKISPNGFTNTFHMGHFCFPNAHWQKSQYLTQNNPKKDIKMIMGTLVQKSNPVFTIV